MVRLPLWIPGKQVEPARDSGGVQAPIRAFRGTVVSAPADLLLKTNVTPFARCDLRACESEFDARYEVA
jgi:hypothetical protein